MFGGKRTYERICRYLARETDSVVVFVDYRLAPEHQHPAQLSDCLSAIMYFMENATVYGVDANCIVLVGDSSGGTLVSGISRELLKKRHVPKIQAQILMYPFLQVLNLSLPSHQQNRFGPGLTMNRIMKLAFMYLNLEPSNFDDLLRRAHVPENRAMATQKWFSADCIPETFKARGYEPPLPLPFSKTLSEKVRMDDESLRSPIEDEDAVVQQLPKTYILTCEYDVFRDDGLLFKKRLEDSGVPVTWNHLQDGFHGCLLFIDIWLMECSCTKLACEDIVNFIKGL
ncbi:hypothetical protein JRQ81_014576 [Phrynocephalus forsythii]|uniref:Alpha/beta hydrolase fold-3 domain-containing protein n=1 Tax=Phrynocephalus forsythii TaxID=171643 RepID=A0A9Q0XXX9_9SAUR|nr:hypothetical protein JRQ81_014576 [Phrynocephalus forsythii]